MSWSMLLDFIKSKEQKKPKYWKRPPNPVPDNEGESRIGWPLPGPTTAPDPDVIYPRPDGRPSRPPELDDSPYHRLPGRLAPPPPKPKKVPGGTWMFIPDNIQKPDGIQKYGTPPLKGQPYAEEL